MTEMESILSESLRVANQTIERQSLEIMNLRKTIEELRMQLSSRDKKIDDIQTSIHTLEEAISLRQEDIKKQKRINKGLYHLLENKSEKQVVEHTKQDPKARGNNSAKRNMHLDMQIEEHDVYPEGVDMSTATELQMRDSIRYTYIPAQFKKIIYHVHSCLCNGQIIRGKAPLAPFQNSSFDGSFIAGLMELRYMYSMPVERIAAYFQDHGFDVDKVTLNGLLQKSAGLLEHLYESLRLTILEDSYLGLDETYMKVIQDERNQNGKHIKKGYIWSMIGKLSHMVYYFYDNGSRSEKVILDMLRNYCGTIQSDGFAPYRKLGGQQYPNIVRIPCLQHIKRKFKEAEGETDADLMISLINELYHNEHLHRIGEDEWTEKKNLKWRKEYAPPILRRIKQELSRILHRKDLDPEGYLYGAALYMQKEMKDVENIFRGGLYDLDNNEVERYNRYISLSRRNSLFFGSHNGAANGALLYSLACSCRMQGINFFEYITGILNQKLHIPDGAGSEAYRDLLPDKWKEKRLNQL